MNDTILYTERQKFNQWWIWLIIIAINGLIIYGIFTQVIGGNQFGNNPMSNIGLLVTGVIILITTLFMMSLKLETIIKTNGIYVRLFPFQISYQHYSWEQIAKLYIRQYKPIMEYGGWGLRGFGKNKALNVSGNMGLQLELNEREKILIGTQKANELKAILEKTGHYMP